MSKTKTFITVISNQGERDGVRMLKPVNYRASGNSKLESDKAVRFPITLAINGYAEPGDNIRIIAIRNQENADAEYNFQNFFLDEIRDVCNEKGVPFDESDVEVIDVPNNESTEAHLKLFSDIIAKVRDNEELYACITFGTKPVPIVLSMALNYAHRIRKNAQVKCIVYGKVYPEPIEVFDTTPLFYMDSIVNKLAVMNPSDPDKAIRSLLGLETEE